MVDRVKLALFFGHNSIAIAITQNKRVMNPLLIRFLLATAVLFAGIPSMPAAADLATGAVPGASTTMAPAAKRTAADASQKAGYYLTGKERVFATFPAAPKLNSDRDHTDLLITLAVQGSRNSDQVKESQTDEHYSEAIKAMNHLVDPEFETTYPETSAVAQLLSHAAEDGAKITHMLKNRNERLRPFVQHPCVVVPLFTVSDFSYPSGHSSGSELQARILAELFPSCAEAVLNKAKLIAGSRVVAGVHYESDIEAGKHLGDLIFSTLKANPKFVRDLDATKAALSRN